MIENFNAELKEISKERQSGTRRNSALIEAWKVLKNGFSVMNEDVRKNIDDYNRRFSQLTLEVDKHIEAVDLKVELLINKTNDMVTKQLKTVGEGFEEIRFELNKTFEDYTGQIDKDITVFINQTQSTLNEIIIDECASDPCRNGATCVDSVHNYTCICMAGFNGNHCQKEIDECSSGPCLSGATCVDGINSYSCRCQVGYMYVDKYCQDIDECVSGPCMNGATCEDGINSYACKCLAGYEGAHCQLDIDECVSGPCINGAKCEDGINGYVCKCLAGYEGTECQIDIDECVSRPCWNGGRCVDGINNYACSCLAGYEGTQCQFDINECASRPCWNDATCVDGINNFSCRCSKGYEGTHCEIDIEECGRCRVAACEYDPRVLLMCRCLDKKGRPVCPECKFAN